MRSSFRGRLLAIAALTLIVCGAAITAILFLARATAEERATHARENVNREVERLRGTLGSTPPDQRSRRRQQSGELQSGYVVQPTDVDEEPFVADALQRCSRAHDLVAFDSKDASGTPVWSPPPRFRKRGMSSRFSGSSRGEKHGICGP